MYLEKNLEKKWIIKSENKILGPYNFDQIVDLLRKKQISIIDEVRDPETRWLYVRENNEFKNVVEEIRKEIDSKQESTKTYQSVAGTSTTTNFEDLAQKTKTDISPFTDISMETKDAEVVKETNVMPSVGKIDAVLPKVEKARMYGVQGDAVVQKSVADYSSRIKIGAAAASVLILTSLGGYYYFQKRSVVKQEEEQELQVKKYKYLGLYQKAVDVYATLPEASQKKLLPELLDTYPLLESSGEVTLEEVRSLKSDPAANTEQKAYVELINFQTAIKQQNLAQAEEALLKAGALQPTMPLIKENEALLMLAKKDFTGAFNGFKKLSLKEKSGRYLLGMSQAYIGLSDQEKAANAKDLLRDLESYTIIYYDFRKELLLTQIYLSRSPEEEMRHKFSLEQFFNTPCKLSSQFKKPLLLLPNAYQWKELSAIMAKAREGLTGDESILFELHDLLERGKIAEAAEFVNSNTPKVANEQIREQMNLLLLNEQDRSREVLAIRKSNKLDMNSELNQFLIAMNTLKIEPKRSIQEHLQFLEAKNLFFYKEWLELEQLVLRNATDEIRNYLKEHFITIKNFNPVFEARNKVN